MANGRTPFEQFNGFNLFMNERLGYLSKTSHIAWETETRFKDWKPSCVNILKQFKLQSVCLSFPLRRQIRLE